VFTHTLAHALHYLCASRAKRTPEKTVKALSRTCDGKSKLPKEDVMKRTMMKLTAALALAVTFGIATAYAQTNANLRADVPFNFMVGKNAIPSGNCGVVLSSQVARIACADERAGIVGQDARKDATGTPKLVFHKYGDQYFLAEVWTASKGLILAESPAEREMRASAATPKYTTTAVLLHAIP
jgi:hypothetical protein